MQLAGRGSRPYSTGHYLKTSWPPFMAQSFRPRRCCSGPAPIGRTYGDLVDGGSKLLGANAMRAIQNATAVFCECCVGMGACNQGRIGEGVAATIDSPSHIGGGLRAACHVFSACSGGSRLETDSQGSLQSLAGGSGASGGADCRQPECPANRPRLQAADAPDM